MNAQFNVSSPLMMDKVEGNKVFIKIDYLKALLDYEVEASLPAFSKEEFFKLVNFFITNDVVNVSRPGYLKINHIDSPIIDGNYVCFTIIVKESLNTSKEQQEFFDLFSSYFDVWAKKFILVFGKYSMAANLGKLDEFTNLN